MTLSRSLLRLASMAVLLSACASSPKRPAEQPQRVPDSAPDKAAALRSQSGLHQEEDEQRWGIEAAKERKQRREQQQQQQQAPAPPGH